MKIKNLVLGPIHCSIKLDPENNKVRHRFWGQGIPGSVGIIRLRKQGDGLYQTPRVFTMSADYCETGIIDFILDPNTHYDVQIGYIKTAMRPEEIISLHGLDWSKLHKCTMTIKTFPSSASPNTETRFVLGSCRHKGIRSDHAFKNIKHQHNKNNIDFLLMTGDQVYADHDIGVFGLKPKSLKNYKKKYFTYFRKKNFRAVLKTIPAYMILDDHEIQNDFGKGLFLGNNRSFEEDTTFKYGLKSYQSFQANVSPVIERDEILDGSTYGDIGYENHRYYYNFTHGNSAFFVLDVRCEREQRCDHSQNMISEQQLEAMFYFLTRHPDHVKFIVSPVPFFPDTQYHDALINGAPDDKWAGYSKQRNHILAKLEADGLNDVIFLSGDVHCSFVSTLEKNDFRVHSIISSAFNWTVFGLNDMHFHWDGIFDNNGSIDNTWAIKRLDGKHVITNNNYAVISVKNRLVRVIFYSDSGRYIREASIQL